MLDISSDNIYRKEEGLSNHRRKMFIRVIVVMIYLSIKGEI
jgi:hypothetical protein